MWQWFTFVANKNSKTISKPLFEMKKTLNIDIDPAMMMTVAATLKHGELGRLFRALTARMGGEEADRYLNNSGLRLAFALLSPAIDESLQRLALNRANGAKGGRPRKQPAPIVVETQNLASPSQEAVGSSLVSTKKREKEDLPPIPPIEEKAKKKDLKSLSPDACAREEEKPAIGASVIEVPDLETLQQQMLTEQPWLDELCMSRRVAREDMETYIQDFVRYLKDCDARESLPQAKHHFVNQLPHIIKIYKTKSNHETHPKFIADPVARRRFERESRRQEVCRALARLAAAGGHPVDVPF